MRPNHETSVEKPTQYIYAFNLASFTSGLTLIFITWKIETWTHWPIRRQRGKCAQGLFRPEAWEDG